jgi:hypothetical protein
MAPRFFYQKGHGAQKKGHGAAPFYFSLDKTLIYTILDVPVSCIYNTGIPESLIYAQYRKLQYSSSNNTGNTSIVKHTIPTGSSSILHPAILVILVL